MASISRPTDEEHTDEGVLLFVLLFWKEIYHVCLQRYRLDSELKQSLSEYWLISLGGSKIYHRFGENFSDVIVGHIDFARSVQK